MLRIVIPIALLSENQANRAIRRGNYCTIIKSEIMRKWEDEFQKQLKPFKNEIRAFEASHDRNKQGVEIKIVHKTPKFFTKKGTISENSVDVDNIKNCQDALFSNFEKIKDSQIIALHSYKMYAEKHSIIIELSSVDIGKICHS